MFILLCIWVVFGVCVDVRFRLVCIDVEFNFMGFGFMIGIKFIWRCGIRLSEMMVIVVVVVCIVCGFF